MEGGIGMTPKRYRLSFWSDENVEPDSNNRYTVLEYTKNH